jgi:hypothetical protein
LDYSELLFIINKCPEKTSWITGGFVVTIERKNIYLRQGISKQQKYDRQFFVNAIKGNLKTYSIKLINGLPRIEFTAPKLKVFKGLIEEEIGASHLVCEEMIKKIKDGGDWAGNSFLICLSNNQVLICDDHKMESIYVDIAFFLNVLEKVKEII